MVSDTRADPQWHTRLKRALADEAVQHRRPDRALLILPALAIFAAIVLGALLKDLLLARASPDAHLIADIIFVLISIFGVNRFLVFPLSRKIQQITARNANDEIKRDLSRQPILYLRSFDTDPAADRLAFLLVSTPETRLVRVLHQLGPVLAIGRPGEKLPMLGAARFHVDGDHWQRVVSEIAAASQLVVVASGTTQGLKWELAHLFREEPPEKVILWTHPYLAGLGAQKREAEWGRFLAACGNLFIKPLPCVLGPTRFFHFLANYKPQPTGPSRYLLGWAQDSALMAVLAAKEVLPAWKYRVSNPFFNFAIATTAGMVVLYLSSFVYFLWQGLSNVIFRGVGAWYAWYDVPWDWTSKLSTL